MEEVLAEYRRKGLASPVGFGRRPAILVVDVIVGFTDLESPLAADLDSEVEAICRLLDAARGRRVPVFFTTTTYGPDCRDAGYFLSKVPSLETLQHGSRWVEIDPRLGRRPEETVFDKKYASAFFGTALASTLRSLRVDTVLVTGCTTSGCVRASVVDAIQHGFRPIVPRQCVGDRAPEPHRANLLDIHGKYGDVVELDEALEYLAGIER
ncbi:MAG: isochorismatase family protein [bacterium]|nr:isochorismatase family protein [bacterium]